MLSRPLLDRVAFFGISWYAILITGAIVIGYLLASGEARRLHLPQDTVIDFLLYAIPLGLICARLYYVAFRFNDYSEDLLSVFNIREGGMAIYGGVIGGLIAARLVSRKHKISMLTLLDVVAPALVLGQGIGRWGNYINMEAYGLRIAEESLQFFPFAVEIPVGDVWYWHMATFFYEFCWDMLVFVLLMVIRNHRRRKGDVFCWYLLLYCSGRTVIEGLRNDSLTFISEFVRISQILSAVAALGVVIYFFLRIRDRISAVTVVPMVSAVLCIAVAFLGEFERGAYSFLFTFSQIGLAVLMISQIAAQCRKLLPVIAVKILDEAGAIQREFALIKVKTADRNARDEVMQMSNIFRAKIIDVGRDTLTVAIFGDKDKTGALIALLEDFGILEIAKTGTLAIERGRSTIYDDNKLKEEYNYGKNVL